MISLWLRVGLGVCLSLATGFAQEEVEPAADPVEARTAEDPLVAREALRLALKPMRAEQLAAEAEAWTSLLEQQNELISARQIALLATTGSSRAQLLTELNGELERRTGLVDRLQEVLLAWQRKGGEVEPYELYVEASSGVEVQPTDVHALWSMTTAWLMSPEGGIRLGINIVQFVLTLLAFALLARILARLAKQALSRVRTASELLREFFVNAVSKLTFFVGIVIALSMLEIDIGPFVAAIGAAGFIIGFALQGTLSNFAAGIMILIYRPYDIGDFVTVASMTGSVAEMTLVSTTLRLPDNQTVVVPNNSIWGDVITNVTGSPTRRVDMKFGVGYGDDLEQAQRLLTEIVTSHPAVLDDPAPVIRVHELADSSVNFVVRPWTRTADYWSVYWDITHTVKERFDSEGISIPFPQRDVHVHHVSAASGETAS